MLNAKNHGFASAAMISGALNNIHAVLWRRGKILYVHDGQ
jgi:hypothetical protein